MNDISLFVALGAGVLSFLSPCILPMVPVYLASLAGPELSQSGTGGRRFHIFLHSLSFVIGLGVVFTIIGGGLGLLGFSLSTHRELVRNISGGVLIFFGLTLLLSSKIPWLNYEKRLSFRQSSKAGYLRSFLTGGAFTLAWTPCVGPVLGGILALAWSSETVFQGAYLLAFYSLGMGVPFLVIGAAFDSVSPLLKRMRRYSGIIYLISAVLLITVGILTLLNKLSLLQSF